MTGRWSGKRLAVAIAVTLVVLDLAFDVFSVAIYGWDGAFTKAVRLALTIALAYFLATGRSWARWTVVILCVVGLPTALYALALILPLQHAGLVTMVVLHVASYAVVGGLLAFAPPVRDYFKAARGVSTSQA